MPTQTAVDCLHSSWPHLSVPVLVFLPAAALIPSSIDIHSLSAALKNVPAYAKSAYKRKHIWTIYLSTLEGRAGREKKERKEKKSTSEYGSTSSILFGITADCNWQSPGWWSMAGRQKWGRGGGGGEEGTEKWQFHTEIILCLISAWFPSSYSYLSCGEEIGSFYVASNNCSRRHTAESNGVKRGGLGGRNTSTAYGSTSAISATTLRMDPAAPAS